MHDQRPFPLGQASMTFCFCISFIYTRRRALYGFYTFFACADLERQDIDDSIRALHYSARYHGR